MIASFTALGVGKGKENLTNAKLRIRELQGKVTEKKKIVEETVQMREQL